MAEETPMMKQYKKIKAQYEDAFLFYRLGDFYELFYDDAIKAAKELEITLTKRGNKNDQDIPMCGVPYHSAEQYIATLIEKGYKIAICEQVEDPKKAKGVVKREVIQLITPGTVMDGHVIDEKENNFIAALFPFEDGTATFVKADLTTGEMKGTMLSEDASEWEREIVRKEIKELIVPPSWENSFDEYAVVISTELATELQEEFMPLCDQLHHEKLKKGVALLTNYLKRTQKRVLDHLQPLEVYDVNELMQLDVHTRRNLELMETLRDKKKEGSLLWVLDETVTAMGARLLKSWLEAPLLDRKTIEKRHAIVASFVEHFFEREELREKLQDVYDLERLAGKTAYGNMNARDLVQLRTSLQTLPAFIQILEKIDNPHLLELIEKCGDFHELQTLLEKSIVDDPPVSITEGGMIRKGYHEQLDRYKEASANGKAWISQLEQKEREETGIKSLKVGYNKVFGYYIEVTKPNIRYLEKDRYERKQTLANAERFITPELKEKERLILEAEEESTNLEYELFLEIREEVKKYLRPLQETARVISEIDVLLSFATISERYDYVRPTFTTDRSLEIKNGRHPVVERMIGQGEYVANDMTLNHEREMLLITGPNMSGKSTYMRQTALLVIMAQIGSFVPATSAKLPIFDQIFTRIGAADDLASGESTFMVEMLETKRALTKATPNSLLLLDEIGRGTSTYDGMSLAQAIIEYIHDYTRAKTLFSTHYHELTALEETLDTLHNVHVKAVEEDGEIVFLHKVEEGKADRSYGIYVAKLAGLPERVVERANELLYQYESKEMDTVLEQTRKETVKEDAEQLPLFSWVEEEKRESEEDEREDIVNDIKKLDVLRLSPIEALEKLYTYQKKLQS
ncbi:DNA mismatch repair protein MutS [Aliibacillus thermotolerans]|uniref:DNA mismatch repair protein MutS n=1 Tax=Aliibacillus thermotolerans TaxID=1834418 RepID=UPI0022EADD69|nr:DNA mismatch repair protein MutS [Aliibacillus thermotolerans]MDA3130537.1 DNA mismatch repair protein MutS [Aliibacillus thermotolerans]